jgi:hypothetical protein
VLQCIDGRKIKNQSSRRRKQCSQGSITPHLCLVNVTEVIRQCQAEEVAHANANAQRAEPVVTTRASRRLPKDLDYHAKGVLKGGLCARSYMMSQGMTQPSRAALLVALSGRRACPKGWRRGYIIGCLFFGNRSDDGGFIFGKSDLMAVKPPGPLPLLRYKRS